MNYLNTEQALILFQEAVRNPIYVDKSKLIDKLSMHIRTGDKYICITRPRRFGKTINANMLGAYYTKGHSSQRLFDVLEVSKTENYLKHLNQHNVVKNRNYVQKAEGGKEVLLVGINYSKEKRHECRIEMYNNWLRS